MSLRSRARRLQRAFGLAYEQIEVVDVALPADPIARICARLADETLARAVMLFDGTRLLARVGRFDAVALAACIVGPRRPQLSAVVDLGDGRSVHSAPLDGGRAVLAVIFDESTSVGLVRLRTARAIEELEPLLARRRSTGAPPPPARGGPSGLPAEAWLSVAALRKRRS